MTRSYTVVAPLAIVSNSEQAGRKEYLYAGSPLPGYVSEQERERLLEEGYVAVFDSVVAVAVSPSTSPEQLNTEVLVPLPSKKAAATPPRA